MRENSWCLSFGSGLPPTKCFFFQFIHLLVNFLRFFKQLNRAGLGGVTRGEKEWKWSIYNAWNCKIINGDLNISQLKKKTWSYVILKWKKKKQRQNEMLIVFSKWTKDIEGAFLVLLTILWKEGKDHSKDISLRMALAVGSHDSGSTQHQLQHYDKLWTIETSRDQWSLLFFYWQKVTTRNIFI